MHVAIRRSKKQEPLQTYSENDTRRKKTQTVPKIEIAQYARLCYRHGVSGNAHAARAGPLPSPSSQTQLQQKRQVHLSYQRAPATRMTPLNTLLVLSPVFSHIYRSEVAQHGPHCNADEGVLHPPNRAAPGCITLHTLTAGSHVAPRLARLQDVFLRERAVARKRPAEVKA